MAANQTPAVPQRRLHPNPLSIWAASSHAPIHFQDGDGRLSLPGEGDTPQGQDGWKVALDFANLRHLAECLGGGAFELPSHARHGGSRTLEPHQIHRLAIHAHGGPGVVDVNCMTKAAQDDPLDFQDDPRFLNLVSLKAGTYDTELDLIRSRFHDSAKVFFMGCCIAAGKLGTQLLLELSRRWDGVQVCAPTSVGYSHSGRQQRSGLLGTTYLPGMRDTRYANLGSGLPRDYDYVNVWNDLNALPWASEKSPHMRIAYKGVLLREGREAEGG